MNKGTTRRTQGAVAASRTTDPRMPLLLAILDEAYDRPAWHGPNLRGSLRRMTAREAAWRPAPGRHNIWEIAVHAAYWKYAVRRRLTGEKRGSFPLRGSNWFERPATGGTGSWEDDLRLLDAMHRALRAAVAGLRGADLVRVPPGGRNSVARLVAGAALHDVYHAGQIRGIKRLMP